MSEAATELLAYCRVNERVCPLPKHWQRLWELLPSRRQIGSGWEPALPLILAAWHYASDLGKMQRLAEHIEWADKHGDLAAVEGFLHGLAEEDWYHLGE